MEYGEKIIKKVMGKLNPPPPKTMEEILQEYRDLGMTIGERCKIYSPLSKHKDCFLLSIGNDVTVSSNVTFLMHDNAICKPTQNEYTDVLGRIIVEDHCFIGAGVIILPGVTIAHDCIIGAGSVVTRPTVPAYVYAGNPAKPIYTVEEYYQRSKPYMVNIEGFTKDEVAAKVMESPNILRKR